MIDLDALLTEVCKETPEPFRHRVSALGKCVRQRVYDGLGAVGAPSEWAARGMLAAAQGSAMDALLGAAAERAGLGRAQVPVEAMAGNVPVTGTADLVTPDEVIDWKRASSSTWTIASKGGKPEHRAQINVYAHLLDRPRWALVYLHADKPDTLRVVRGVTDAAKAEHDLLTAVEVQAALDAREVSTRPATMSLNRPPCLFCPHLQRCTSDGPEARPYEENRT
jgi:hypothetical protein